MNEIIPAQILGLDLSLTGTGWCTCYADLPEFTITGFGTIKTVPNKKSKGEIVKTFIDQERQDHILDTLLEKGLLGPVCFTGIEDYAFAHASTQLPELQGLVRFMLHKNKRPWFLIATTSLKKYVSGKGNMAKGMIPMHVNAKFSEALLLFGQEISDDNVADAIGLCALTFVFYRWSRNLPLTVELTKENLATLEKLRETNQSLLQFQVGW